MYETYVPITDTIVERKPPTIADIVREKTDDGARIIDFFIGLMEGYVADAQLCHRIDAAKQLVKYGSKPAADFIAEHRDEPCDHCESRRRGPRPRNDASPAAGPLHASGQHAPGPYGYDFLTLLTEDFLTVLSAVDEDLMIMLLRAQTRDGGTVIDFLYEVMQGREDGFKPHHRIAAAKELISHIVRDEQPSHTPSPLTGKGRAEGDLPPLPQGEGRAEGDSSPSPFTGKARVEGDSSPSPFTGEGWGEGDLPPLPQGEGWGEGYSPAPARTQTNGASPVIPAQIPREPVPAQAGFLPQEPSPTQGGGGGHSTPANSAHPEPVPSTVEEPKIVRPELVEGQYSGDSAVPGPAANEVVIAAERSQLRTNNQQLRTLPTRRTRTQRRREGNARAAMRRKAQESQRSKKDDEQDRPARKRSGMRLITGSPDEEPKASPQLTPAERRIREKLEAHWHEPDPWDGPIDSTTPGRSPPS